MTSATPTTFLFLHGSPGSARDFEPLLALAPAGTRVKAIDLLDHGSGADDASDDFEATIRFVEQTVAAIDGRVVLVGHSFGAWLATFASSRLDGRIERIVAIDGLAALPKDAADQFDGLGSALLTRALTVENVVPIAVQRWIPQPPDPTLEGRIATGLAAQTPERLGRSLRRLRLLAEPRYRVTRIGVPTTFVHAREDIAVPLALGLELADTAGEKQVNVLPLEGHFPHWTHPELVAPLVYR